MIRKFRTRTETAMCSARSRLRRVIFIRLYRSKKEDQILLVHSRQFHVFVAGLFALAITIARQGSVAQDLVHMKHVAKASKTVVIKSADGTDKPSSTPTKRLWMARQVPERARRRALPKLTLARKEKRRLPSPTQKTEKTAVGVKDAAE